MARQTIMLGMSLAVTATAVEWTPAPRPQVDSALTPTGMDRFILSFKVNADGTIELDLADTVAGANADDIDLSAAFEATPYIGITTTEFALIARLIPDPTEPYRWYSYNTEAVIGFFAAHALTMQYDGTLTLGDEPLTPSTIMGGTSMVTPGVQITETTRPVIRPVTSTTVCGLIGQAPNADATVLPESALSVVTPSTAEADLGDEGAGRIRDAVAAIHGQVDDSIIVYRVPEAPANYTQANMILGVQAMESAEQQHGLKPDLIAPLDFMMNINGGATPLTDANAVVTALEAVCESIKSVGFVQSWWEGTNLETAVTNLLAWAVNNRGERILPFPSRGTGGVIVTPYAMGALAARDVETPAGVAVSPLGLTLRGLTSLEHNFVGGIEVNASRQLDRLIAGGFTGLLRGTGLEWWGAEFNVAAHTASTRFLPIRRVVDEIRDLVLNIGHNYIRAGISGTAFLDGVSAAATGELSTMASVGKIAGGAVEASADRNNEAARTSGQHYFVGDFDAIIPAVRVHFDIVV